MSSTSEKLPLSKMPPMEKKFSKPGQSRGTVKTINWTSKKNFVRPFMIMLNHKVYCMMCNCHVLNSASMLDVHERGLRHGFHLDKHQFYIFPLENDGYFCLCCYMQIDNMKNISVHIMHQSHENHMKIFESDKLKYPIDWNSSEIFISPFVARSRNNDSFCTLCNCWLQSPKDISLHVKQLRHISALQCYGSIIMPLKNDYYFCVCCTFVFPFFTNIHKHVRGRRHCTLAKQEVDWKFQNFVHPFVYQVTWNHFYCMICDKSMNNLLELESHVKDKIHISRLKRDIDCVVPLQNGTFHCKFCNCIISSYDTMYPHVAGMKHRNSVKKCTETLATPQTIERSSIDNSVEPFVFRENNGKFNCTICNLIINTTRDLEMHVNEKSHVVAVEKDGFFIKLLANDSFYCNLCNVTITKCVTINKHLSGSVHKDKLRMFREKNDDYVSQLMANGLTKEKNLKILENKRESSVHKNVNSRTSSKDENSVEKFVAIDKFADSSFVKAKVTNSKLSDQTINLLVNDTELNFPIRSRNSQKSSDNNSQCHGIECIICNSILKNHDYLGTDWKITKKMQSEVETDDDRKFSTNLKNVAKYLEKLRIPETSDISNTRGGEQIFRYSEKDNSILSSILTSLKYLIDVRFDESTRDNSEKSESSKSMLMIENRSVKGNSDIESGTIYAYENLYNDSTTDSGIDDFAARRSASTISNENSQFREALRKISTEKIVKFMNYDRDIYDMSEITDMIKCNRQLSFVIDEEDDYCLICREIVPNELHRYLEHLSNSQHADNYDEIMYEHVRDENNSKNLSSLSLAYEYIDVFRSKDSTMCLVCSIEIPRNDEILKKHIEDISHRRAWKEMQNRGEIKFEILKSEIQCDWYKVIKFKCLPCLKRFNYEINFIDHLESEEHKGKLDNQMIHGFCGLCGLLWCAHADDHIDHCDSLTHQWFVKNQPLAIDDLPESTKSLLAILENIEHFKVTYVNREVMDEIVDSCRNSIANAHAERSGRYSDSDHETFIDNIMLIKFFNKRFPLCEKVVSFLSRWLISCDLSGSQCITNHALYWYFIFYLQSVLILPSLSSLNSMTKYWLEIAHSDDVSEVISRKSTNSHDFKKHLIGFFAFYANYDYHYDVACPLIGGEIKKISFAVPHWLPDEIRSSIFDKKNDGFAETFAIDSVMCLQDPFDLRINLTKTVTKLDLIRFRKYCSKSLALLTPKT